jgi:hypothetical protein
MKVFVTFTAVITSKLSAASHYVGPCYAHRKAEVTDREADTFCILDDFGKFLTACAKVFTKLS